MAVGNLNLALFGALHSRLAKVKLVLHNLIRILHGGRDHVEQSRLTPLESEETKQRSVPYK